MNAATGIHRLSSPARAGLPMPSRSQTRVLSMPPPAAGTPGFRPTDKPHSRRQHAADRLPASPHDGRQPRETDTGHRSTHPSDRHDGRPVPPQSRRDRVQPSAHDAKVATAAAPSPWRLRRSRVLAPPLAPSSASRCERAGPDRLVPSAAPAVPVHRQHRHRAWPARLPGRRGSETRSRAATPAAGGPQVASRRR